MFFIFFEFHPPHQQTLESIPNGHERDPKKESKRSAKLSHKSVKGIDEHLLLKQGVLGQGPEAEGDLVLREVVVRQVLENLVHELVLLVHARLLVVGDFIEVVKSRKKNGINI